jgi:hypothetical protein
MRKDLVTLVIAAVAAAVVIGLTAPVPAQAGGPFQYFAVTPCRVVDSRTTNALEGTNGSPLSNGPHNVRIQGQCGIPNGAAAVSLNFTVSQPTQDGHLTIYPSNVSSPLVSTLNFLAGEPGLANGALVPLAPVVMATDTDLVVRIAMAPGTSHIIVDATGYFQ